MYVLRITRGEYEYDYREVSYPTARDALKAYASYIKRGYRCLISLRVEVSLENLVNISLEEAENK